MTNTTRNLGAVLAGLALAASLAACGGSDSKVAVPATSSAGTTPPAAAPSTTGKASATPAPAAPSTTVVYGVTITSPAPGAPGSGAVVAGGDCSGNEGSRAEADQGGAPMWCTHTTKGTVWLAAQSPTNTHQPAITQGCGNAGDRERDVHTGQPLVCRAAPAYGGQLTWLASS